MDDQTKIGSTSWARWSNSVALCAAREFFRIGVGRAPNAVRVARSSSPSRRRSWSAPDREWIGSLRHHRVWWEREVRHRPLWRSRAAVRDRIGPVFVTNRSSAV